MRVAPPTHSYIIWFTQRVGSTLLTQALEDTGIAGRPREWLEGTDANAVLAKHEARDAAELRDRLWARGTTANGILGIKHGMRPDLHCELSALFSQLVAEDVSDDHAAWAAVFPNCKHVVMTRRDRVRLAVSWWRAIKSQEWHRPRRSDTPVGPPDPQPPPPDNMFDRDAIRHLLVEAEAREVAIHAVLGRWCITPHTIVYEDFIASYDATVRGLLEFLEVPGRDAVVIPAPAFDRLSDDTTEAWYRRYIAG